MPFLITIPKPKRIELADKLVEQQKGVVRHWRELWDTDRENRIGIKESENYKMYMTQLSKLNAYNEMYLVLLGTSEELDFVAKTIDA